MIDEHDVREMLQRRAATIPATPTDTPTAVRRARRRLGLNGAVATVAAAAITVATFAGVDAIRSERVPAEHPTPTPAGPILRRADEVLLFTGSWSEAGDLVAVTPRTGEERVLVGDLGTTIVSNARWSTDGRWAAYETPEALWVIDRELEPRLVFEEPRLWAWSSTGTRLAVIRGSTLSVVDPSTGRATALASTVGDVTSVPLWSPDGRRIVFGARGGSIYSVDVRTGERSRIARMPGKNLDSIDGLAFTPDGSRLAIYNDLEPGDGRLIVMDADGSDIRVFAGYVFGFDWSPDGSRIAFTEDHGAELRVFVVSADGSTRSLVASLAPSSGTDPVWSPDGSQIALGRPNAILNEDAENLLIDADGSGEAEPLDDLTYESWRGGAYECNCDIFG
jgi:dipeptidyl aminopeptidase/acylaminoacyl peptidase